MVLENINPELWFHYFLPFQQHLVKACQGWITDVFGIPVVQRPVWELQPQPVVTCMADLGGAPKEEDIG